VRLPARRLTRRTGRDDGHPTPDQQAGPHRDEGPDLDDRVIVVPPVRVATAEPPAPADDEQASALVRRYRTSGFVGALLIAVGAYGSGWVSLASGIADLPVISTVRSQPALTFTAKLVMIVGVGLLLQAWLRLGNHIRTRRVVHARALNRLAWWWGVPLALSPVLFSRDVFSYIAQSRLAPQGLDPYVYGTGVYDTFFTDGADWMWKTAPAPYGQFWMGLSSVVYWITHAQALGAMLLFRLLAVAGVVLIAIYLPRMATCCGVDPAKAIWLGVLNPLVLLHFVSSAHNDALMVGLLVMGMTLALERRPVLAVVAVALGGAVKAPAFLGLAFVGIAWAGGSRSTFWQRCLRWAESAAIAAGVLVTLWLATGLGFGWISSLGTPGKVWTWLSPTTGLGITTGNLLSWLGFGYHVEGAVEAWRDVGTVLTVIAVLWLILTGHRRSPARGLGIALLTMVVLGPVVQPWYLLWGLVVLAGAGLSRVGTKVTVLVSIGFVVYSVANSGATVPTYVFLQDGIATLVSCAVVLALLAVSKRSRSLLMDDVEREPDQVDVREPLGSTASRAG
jgi:hypothetical protein